MQLIDDLNYGLAAFGIQIPTKNRLDEFLADKVGARPATSAAVLVIAGGLLMHHFEKHVNPKMRDIYDAMLYCATSLSVGYAESHPMTKPGKLLATIIQTYGPALAAKTLDGPATTSGQQESSPANVESMMRLLVSKLETKSRDET